MFSVSNTYCSHLRFDFHRSLVSGLPPSPARGGGVRTPFPNSGWWSSLWSPLILFAVKNFLNLPQLALLATPVGWERDGSIFSASYSSKCHPTCKDNLPRDGLHPQVLKWRTWRENANEYINITYLNCGERYEDIADNHSYVHNLGSCEIKAWKEKLRNKQDSNAWPLRHLSCQANWALVTWLDAAA